ncbi:MAG: anthranilate phosphoribosyltransferase [Thermodesulfobacteriota bacterium]|nr:anthranilate phosphoribosyltransferase [Thermodesulfobacteriota bacterium]
MSFTIKDGIAKVVDRFDLAEEEMVHVMHEIMEGGATPSQIGAFITALRMKGESIEEITGAARVMREKATRITVRSKVIDVSGEGDEPEVVMDTCGTGGDQAHTFNISTASAFVVAAAGIKVAKHGNRSVSSMCGSADVFEALGINIELSPHAIERCLDELGIGFLYAPALHSAMKHATPPRREIGIRTIFNLLGPLTNPAMANVQVMGVYDPKLTEKLVHVLRKLTAKSAVVVCGEDGLDEVTLTGKTRVSHLQGGTVTTYHLTPADFGFHPCSLNELQGGNRHMNADIITAILSGEKGVRRDIVVANAAVALSLAKGIQNLKEAVRIAEEVIDSGKGLTKLKELIALTHQPEMRGL